MAIQLSAFADECSSSFAGQIDALRRNNIPYIEIRNVDGVNVSRLSEQAAAEYSRQLQQAGIQVWSIGSPLGKIKITDDFEPHLELTRHTVKLAKIFGCKRIRMFSFFTAEHDKYRNEVIKRLNRMCAVAREGGVQLCHENEKDIYGDKAHYAKDLIDNVEGLKSIFDPANYVQVGQNMDEALLSMATVADYYHIKDALTGSGEVTPAGLGDGKLREMLAMLEGKDKVLSLEPHLRIFDGYKNIDSHELKNKYTFASNEEAFDTAANALKGLLIELGYKEAGQKWVK